MPFEPGELADWLVLWRTPGIGPAAFAALRECFGAPGRALGATQSQLKDLGLTAGAIESLRTPNREGVERDLAWAAQPGQHILTIEDPLYPPQLREIAQPPPLLFVKGNPRHLADPQIAIVGSRHPTPGGRENACVFAEALARAGLGVTSGLALGIDAAAHEGALKAGGLTIAVAATGLDCTYPARNRALAERIAETGALVSEFPTGVGVRAEFFPRRNRIISGLSLGALVVEAARRSGSLITARFAIEQGREVFAVPGSIHNPMAKGCHRLIRQGAKLAEAAGDVLEELAPLIAVETVPTSSEDNAGTEGPALDADHKRVLECLGFDPIPIDTLIERSGLTAEAVSSMLLILELQGHVAGGPGGLYSRLSPEP